MTFQELISYENLYRAHRVARLCKRHKKEVIEFEMNLSENLWNMYYDLLYGRYKMGEYHRFMIYDPKEREVQAICYRDRIMQHVVCDNYLQPLLDRKLIYYNVACRKGKGSSLAIKGIRKFMSEHYKKYGTSGYFIKADIRKYFDSINHDLLKIKLANMVDDDRILNLLFHIIDSYEKAEGKGLPLGNQTSQIFALLYLDSLDKHISCKMGVGKYVRYMDDVVVLVDNKCLAKKVIDEIARVVDENLLYLNPKSQIISARNSVTFLGWRFYFGKNGSIVQEVKKNSKHRILKHVDNLPKNLVPRQILASYRGYLLQGNGFGLFSRVKNKIKD